MPLNILPLTAKSALALLKHLHMLLSSLEILGRELQKNLYLMYLKNSTVQNPQARLLEPDWD